MSRCWWCNAESVRLCDELVGMERRKSDNTLIVSEPYLCDAELCLGCVKQIGHVSGTTPDSIDRCPVHALGSVGLDRLVTTAEAADRIRRDIKTKARRSQLRMVAR